MNKNIVIGVLVIIVLLAGGYYIFNTSSSQGTDMSTTTSATDITGTGQSGGTDQSSTPGAPVVITEASVAPTNSTAVVTGTVTPNGAQTTYWYEYGASANLGSKTSAQTIGSGWTAIASPGYITGLQPNTSYFFRLTASNAYGTVNGPTYGFNTNNNPAGQGTAPAVSTNAAKSITSTGATVNAQVNPHSSVTTFWFEYGTTPNFGGITTFESAGNTNTSSSVSAQLSGLAPQTTYYFRVNAQNQYGTVNGATQNFTTSGPAASALPPVVTTQVASPVTTTTATLRGTVNNNGASATYWFEYSTDSLLGSALLRSTPQNTLGASGTTQSISANISGLKSGTTYYYRSVAHNSAGIVRGSNQTLTTK